MSKRDNIAVSSDNDKLQNTMEENKADKEEKDSVMKEKQKLTECSNTKIAKRIHPTSIVTIMKEEEFGMTDEEKTETLFQNFISVCRDSSKSLEMKKILLKTNGYYSRTKPEYIRSLEFRKLLTQKIEEIIRDPRRVYVYMKEVVDEMRSRKRKPKKAAEEPPSKRAKLESDDTENIRDARAGSSKKAKGEEEDGEKKEDIAAIAEHAEDKYKERKIKKLSKALKRIHSVIKKLEEKECDWDDDNDSNYIKEMRYKERFVKVHEKLCELTGDTSAKKCRGRVEFSGTEYPEVNRCIEKFVNKTGQFPDFHDIHTLVKNAEMDKSMKPEALRRIAEKAFLSIGRQLKKKRQYETWDAVAVFLKDQPDPAEEDPELESMLKKSAEENEKRIQEVLDEFAEQQDSANLEPEEVPDDVADKSEGSGQEDNEEEEEGEAEAEKEEKDFLDKVLKSDDEGEEDEEDEDEDEEENDSDMNEDSGSSKEEPKPVHSDGETENRNNTPDAENDSESEDTRTPDSSDYESEIPASAHGARNMGPVSPPVLGEVLTEESLDCNEASEKTQDDSDVLVCPIQDPLSINSDKNKTTETEPPVKNGCPVSKSAVKCGSPASQKDDNSSVNSEDNKYAASTASVEDDLPSPSLLEPIIETVIDDKKSDIEVLKTKTSKFVVTKVEVETRKRKYTPKHVSSVRQPRVSSRIVSLSNSSTSSIDIITLE